MTTTTSGPTASTHPSAPARRIHGGRFLAVGRGPVSLLLAMLVSLGVFAVAADAHAHAEAAAAATPPAGTPFQLGTRLTWQSGDSTLQGVRLVPDANGWLWRDDQWWSVQSSGGSGGVGLEQLDIVAVGADGIVADVRFFLNTDLQLNTHVASGAGVITGDDTALAEYWVAPARLAAMQPGFDGSMRIWRGPRQIGGSTFDTVSIAITGNGSYLSRTYDLRTGLLLLGGSMNASPGVVVTDDGGNVLDQARGSVAYTHKIFAGARQVTVPWSGAAVPSWATVGRVTSYQGQSRAHLDDTSGLPQLGGQEITVDHIFEQRRGDVILGRQVTRVATSPGLPPIETTTQRAFSTRTFDGVWIPATALAGLEPGQVLDQDAWTGRVTTFVGVVQSSAVIVSRGPGDQLEQYYDVATGTLVFSRYQLETAVGVQITELSLVGQR